MASKWCSNCGKIVTSSRTPTFCAWCGTFLTGPLLPDTPEDREKIINLLKKYQTLPNMDDNGQVKLF